MKLKSAFIAFCASAVCFVLTACNPTFQCGTWVFSGTPTGNAFPLSSGFTFNPSSCGQNCPQSQDVIIQMVWVYDEDTHTNLYASDQPQGTRSTPNGWAIDQILGYAYGYYGELNDGTFTAVWNAPGGPGVATTLLDEPSGWGADTMFYAVDVAVCYNSSSCNNKILGYYFWSYSIDSTDTGHTFITAPAWQSLDTEFQDAVTAWNSWAPTSGPQTDPFYGTGTLPNAVAFPALSDL